MCWCFHKHGFSNYSNKEISFSELCVTSFYNFFCFRIIDSYEDLHLCDTQTDIKPGSLQGRSKLTHWWRKYKNHPIRPQWLARTVLYWGSGHHWWNVPLGLCCLLGMAQIWRPGNKGSHDVRLNKLGLDDFLCSTSSAALFWTPYKCVFVAGVTASPSKATHDHQSNPALNIVQL